MKVKCTIEEIQDGTIGGCTNCGELVYGVEPDARKYECECCGTKTVYGLEGLVVMDMIDLQDEDG